MGGAAVDRQGRAARDVTHPREFAHGALGEARPLLLCRKHLVFPLPAIVVLRTGCDLEGTHLLGDVNPAQVEGEGGDPPVAPGLGRRREVPMPWLIASPFERGVEPEL